MDGAGARRFAHFQGGLAEDLKRLDAMQVQYFHDPLVSAALIGQWQPDDKLTKKPTEMSYDVTDILTGAGPYSVRFEFVDGKNPLDIDSVSLTENDQEISKDVHPGQAATRSKNNAYHLTLPEFAKKTYKVHVTFHASAGPNTKGQIFLYPTPAAGAATKP